jgi:hypothetical protein
MISLSTKSAPQHYRIKIQQSSYSIPILYQLHQNILAERLGVLPKHPINIIAGASVTEKN